MKPPLCKDCIHCLPERKTVSSGFLGLGKKEVLDYVYAKCALTGRENGQVFVTGDAKIIFHYCSVERNSSLGCGHAGKHFDGKP